MFFTQLGIVVSGGFIITAKETGVAKFPAESLAVHCTNVFPIPNK